MAISFSAAMVFSSAIIYTPKNKALATIICLNKSLPYQPIQSLVGLIFLKQRGISETCYFIICGEVFLRECLRLRKEQRNRFFLEFYNHSYHFLHTLHVPPSLAQCLQYLQFLQAVQFLPPLQVL